MARDHNRTRLILKQGNVTSININNDFNSEYNLLGFHNSRSVFEYTEKMSTEDKSVDIVATNKQIIIKPTADSSGIVLIKDKKNIKIPLRKCTEVPKNILKMFNDKKNMAHVTVNNQHLTLNKTPRTYEKRKDKTTYLNPNTDKNVKINIDFKEARTLKANFAASSDSSSSDLDKNKSGIRMVDINKLTGNKLINGAPHKVSIDKVNQLLKGTASKNFIVLKCPLERRKTIDSAEVDKLNDSNNKTKPINKNVCVKTYARSKSLLDKSESPQKPNIGLSDSTQTEYIKIDDEEVAITPDHTPKCIENKFKGDDNVRITVEIDTVSKQARETREIATDMGKIKHFKEKSSSSELNKNQTPAANINQNNLYSDERVGGGILPETTAGKTNNDDVRVQNRKRIQRAKILNKRYIKQEIEKCLKASITSRKKKPNLVQKTLKDSQVQTEDKTLCNTWTQTEIPPSEPYFVSVPSLPPTPIFCGNNNNDSPANIIEENFPEIDDDNYKRNGGGVLFTDVNFGMGPKIELYEKSGEVNAYKTGNNLENLVANVNIPPSHLVSANAMGYLGSENAVQTAKTDGIQAKRAFQDYLRNCCQPDSAGNLPLHIEVMKNDIAEVRKQALMINLWKLPIDTTNANHLTPLHLAVIHNCDQSIVTFLLDRGADLGCTDPEGNNAIHLAVFHNAKTLLRILLQRATDNNFSLSTFNYEGFTPLLLATIEDKLDMVKTFLDFGVDANVRDQKSGRTPLFHALENNNFDMVQHLLCCGADKKIKNFSGTSAHDAVFELEGVSADIKNMIIGKELFTVNSTRAEKRKKGGNTGGDKPTKEVYTKRLKTVKTYKKINLLQ